MSVGTRLKRLRVARGLTQKELAAPHYSHAYISTIEAGRRVPSRAALEHFGAKLGIEVGELATGRPPDLAAQLEIRLLEARQAISAGELEKAQRVTNAVEKEASRFSLSRLMAKAIECSALCMERRGELEEAIVEYDRAIELLHSESLLTRVEAVTGKARCSHLRGDIRYATYILEMTLERLDREGLDEPSALVRIHASLVRAYFDSGLYSKAAESAAEALRLAPRVTDPTRLAQMHVNVALVSIHRGDTEEAIASLLRAEDLYKLVAFETEIGRVYLARGFALVRDGRHPEARELYEAALEVFQRTVSTLDEARVLNELGRMDRLAGRNKAAIGSIRAAIGLLQENDVAELATAQRELALCLIGTDPFDAEKHLRIAIELFERAEESTQLAATYRALGDLLHDRGDRDGGCDAYRTGIVVLEGRL